LVRGYRSPQLGTEETPLTRRIAVLWTDREVWQRRPLTGSGMAKLFMTHPPTNERIERLLRMGR